MNSIKTGLHVAPIVESPADPTAVAAGAAAPVWRGRWDDEAATQAFAARLAACPALAHATLALQGDLGAGKTTFVRHLLRALGVRGRIKSPTYAVVEPHSAIDCPLMPAGEALAIWHFDFYRFNDPREWEDAGFRELFASPGLKLVEWPERVGEQLGQIDAELHLEPLAHAHSESEEQVRLVRFTALSATGRHLLEALQA